MRKLATFVMVALLALSAVAAQEEEQAEAEENLGQVRIAHFAPDAPAVDIYIDGELSAAQGANFGDVTPWFQIPAGSYAFAVVPAGETADNAVIEGVVEVDADSWYTAAAIGLAVDETLELRVIEEDYSPLSFGETRISVFHAIPRVDPVDILADGDTLFALLAYPDSLPDAERDQNDGFDSLTVPEGEFKVQIVSNLDNSTVLVEIGSFTFTQQRHYFVAAVGTIEAPSFVLVSTNTETVADEFAGDIREVATSDATNGFVRVAHLSTGTPPVDVYINGELTDIQSLEFSSLTAFVELPVGTYNVAVTAEDQPLEEAALEFDLTVGGDQYLTAVAYGIIANDTLSATVVEEDTSPLDTGLVRVSMFHAFQGAPPVDLIRDDGLDAIRFLAYPGTLEDNDGFTSVDLLAGNYGFDVVLSDDTTNVVAEIAAIDFVAGRNYFIGVIDGDEGFTLEYFELP